MVSVSPQQDDGQRVVSEHLLEWTKLNASRIDSGDRAAREVLPLAAAEHIIDLGVPLNHSAQLPMQARVLYELAQHSLSIPFALWCHRMVLEFLSLAGGTYAERIVPGLQAGSIPGASAMAPGYKSLTGSGDLDLSITREPQGSLRLSGNIGWASNLYSDAVAVAPAYGPDTSARTGATGGVIVVVPLHAAGVTIGPELELLAMRGTASTFVTFDNVEISASQILPVEFDSFLKQTRPTLSILQASLCLGLAYASFQQALSNATGVNTVVRDEIKALGQQVAVTREQLFALASRVGTAQPAAPSELLSMRLAAGRLATDLASVELKTAGGKAFITSSDTNRRYREATFIPLQAPSETQLRWELAQP